MPKERDPPYVAAGFREDAERLLNEFAEKHTLKFAAFAEIWRELHFSLIFLGREGLRELVEFIEECYRITLLFMDSTKPLMKVGAVYLLYSMYLKQPCLLLKTPVQITISPKQVDDLCELEDYFMNSQEAGDDVMDLAYIITKLFKMEAFNVACFPIPLGPAVPVSLLKLEPLRTSVFKESLSSLSMLNEKEIKNVIQLSRKFENTKKMLPVMCTSSKSKAVWNRFSALRETIQELDDRYNAGLLPNKLSGDIKIEEEFRYLGQRRAYLKSRQFEREAQVGMSRRVRESSDSSPEKPDTPVKRGPGRPRKIKEGRRRKKRAQRLKIEFDATEEEDLQAEVIDNPNNTGENVYPLTRRRRPSKFPRPVRKHYFEGD